MSTDDGTEEHHVSDTLLPMPRRIAQLPSLPVPDAPQHVPAATQRWQHMRKTAIALHILATA
jgi:hypothetical protein